MPLVFLRHIEGKNHDTIPNYSDIVYVELDDIYLLFGTCHC